MNFKGIFNWKVLLIGAVFLIIIFFTAAVGFFVELQWYGEVGYTGVFFTRILTQFKLFLPIFAVFLLIAYIYMIYLKKEYTKGSNVIYTKEQLRSANRKILLFSGVVSAFASFGISSTYWYEILKYINSTSFNLTDPLFNMDISFYIFKLPLYNALYSIIFSILVLLTIATLIFYLFIGITGGMLKDPGDIIRMDRGSRSALGRNLLESAGKQLSFLVSSIFLMIGAGFILKNYDLVYSPRGVAFGASYTDISVTLVFNRIFMVLSILGAVSIFYALFKRKVKMTIWIIGIMLGASLIQGAVEMGVERLIVAPNAMDKEERFINYNIKYTKQGYGLDSIEEKDFPAEQTLTAQDIENNQATINNIRINDFEPALEVYNQLQGIRPYYRFNDIDIDRYNINGKYTQVFIAPREMDQTRIPDQNWLNKYLVFTHGYGIAMSPVNTVTAQGQPNLVIKDIPPVSSVDIKVDRPQIYFGEVTDDYIITNTKKGEMDYPSGDSNKETFYDGKAGIKLNFLNRIVFAIEKGSINFLLSDYITSDSRIIMNRNIVNRVKKVAPFLMYDGDPYIVINDGKLYWIMDGYTISSLYPYSEPYNGINYIRNSVKVIIDAYDGTMDFYLIDEKDPLAVTYSKIFPELFKKYSDIPEGFVEHFRYPEDIFSIQMEVYSKYHMTNSRVFYNKEDLWTVAGSGQSTGQQNVKPEPSFIVMRLPGEAQEEFILMAPYTPSGKENMIAWMGARMDGENYGKLILYKFPKEKMTYGSSQFRSRVEADPVISSSFSLWGQQGSSLIKGNVVIVPIEKSLLYVMPIYIKSSGTNTIPEMRRVVLGYGDTIVMEDTLDKAITRIFGLKQEEKPKTPVPDDMPPVEANVKELIEKANNAFEKAKEAQQSGDWAGYGTYLKELEDALRALESMQE